MGDVCFVCGGEDGRHIRPCSRENVLLNTDNSILKLRSSETGLLTLERSLTSMAELISTLSSTVRNERQKVEELTRTFEMMDDNVHLALDLTEKVARGDDPYETRQVAIRVLNAYGLPVPAPKEKSLGLGEIDVTHVMPEPILDEARAETVQEDSCVTPASAETEVVKTKKKTIIEVLRALQGGSANQGLRTMPGLVSRENVLDGNGESNQSIGYSDLDDIDPF